MKLDKNMYIRWIAEGLKYPDGFSYNEIFEALDISDISESSFQEKYLEMYLENVYNNKKRTQIPNKETIFLYTGHRDIPYKDDKGKYIVNLESTFKYLDYLELKEARKNAKQAFWISIGAIILSLVSIGVAVFYTQTIQLDTDQMQILIEEINK